MSAPLVGIDILSIYEKGGQRAMLPSRMARCIPDVKKTILSIKAVVEKDGGALYLSDLFRSYDMQLQAYLDWKTGKKKAYSQPPGGSMHEAGRAFDLDLGNLKMDLKGFWNIASVHGDTPIIASPDPTASEAWHFDCRGSHKIVYEYYKSGKGNNFTNPSHVMAVSAILAIGLPVDMFKDKLEPAYIQSALIRLGKEIGNIDGDIGPKSKKALDELGIQTSPTHEIITAVDNLLQQKYPGEFFDSTPSAPILFD